MPLIVTRFATAAGAAAAAAGRGWRVAATTPWYALKTVASLFMVHSCLLLVALFMSVAVSAARVQCQAQKRTKKKVKRINMRTCGRRGGGGLVLERKGSNLC